MSAYQRPGISHSPKRQHESLISPAVATKKQKTGNSDHCDSILLEVNHDYSKEERLANKLKECCEKKEPRFQIDSAKFLYRLGKIYENSGLSLVDIAPSKLTPEEFQRRVGTGMICWMQCATLYNAALVRLSKIKRPMKHKSRLELKIKFQLKELCSQILHAADAEDKHADLCAKANTVKDQVKEFRTNINKDIESIPKIQKRVAKKRLTDLEKKKIDSIEKLQHCITDKYKNIMSGIAEFCQNVMGNPPCKFSVVGMGSIAREEITPYSDFEHIITLEDSVSDFDEPKKLTVLKYFRWFSVIFHAVVINLQETIIPCVAISRLNSPIRKEWHWFYDSITTRGICFDGMVPHACKFPLGRLQYTKDKNWCTELIKPIGEMLQYLNSDEDMKNGYHLGDILTKTCYVYGDESIYKRFRTGVVKILQDQKGEERKKSVKAQIIDDLKKFATKSTLFKMYAEKEINIKHVAYRSSSLFVAALGKIYNIYEASSCFEIIRNLRKQQKITGYAERKLMFAIALGCELRLRWYMKSKCQADIVKSNSPKRSAIETFSSIVGTPSTIAYFQIAYALQSDISNHLDLKRNHFHANPQLLNLSIHFCLNDPKKTNTLVHKQKWEAAKTGRLYKFDECLKLLLQDDSVSDGERHDEKIDAETLIDYFFDIGKLLQTMDNFDDAIELFRKSLIALAGAYDISGAALNEITQEVSAEKYLRKLLELVTPGKWPVKDYKKLIDVLFKIGQCLSQMKQFPVAAVYFEACVKMKEIPTDVNEASLIPFLREHGQSLSKSNETDKAIDVLKRTAEITKRTSSDIETDMEYANILCLIGQLLGKNSPEAKRYLTISRSIAEVVYEDDQNNDASTCEMLRVMGECFLNLKQPSEAQIQFEKLLEIKERISMDVNVDKGYAEVLHKMGQCLLDQNKLEQAIKHLTKSRSITEQLSPDVANDLDFAEICFLVGQCYFKLKQSSEALPLFEKSLPIFERCSLNEKTDLKIAKVTHFIGRCCFDMKLANKALENLVRSREIIELVSPNVATDAKLEEVLEDMGKCYAFIKEFRSAQKHFEKSLAIARKLSLNRETDPKIFVKCLEIGKCIFYLDNPVLALKYFRPLLPYKRASVTKLDLATVHHYIGRCQYAVNSSFDELGLGSLRKSLELKLAAKANEQSLLATRTAISLCLVKLNQREKAVDQLMKMQQMLE